MVGTCSHDNYALIWKNGVVFRTFNKHKDWVRCISFSPDNKTFATGS